MTVFKVFDSANLDQLPLLYRHDGVSGFILHSRSDRNSKRLLADFSGDLPVRMAGGDGVPGSASGKDPRVSSSASAHEPLPLYRYDILQRAGDSVSQPG